MARQPVLTRDVVLGALARLEATVEEWNQSSDPALWVDFGGRNVRQLSQAIEECCKLLFEICDTVEVERAARPIVLAADAFEAAMMTYLQEYNASPSQVDPSGTKELWGAYRDVMASRKERQNKKPEPMAQLIAEGHTREHMAKVYRFLHPDGSPNVHMVQEEITTPGKHYDPDKWQHPRYREYWEKVDAQWEKRLAAIKDRPAPSKPKEKRVAPESLDELLMLPEITAAQIAKMKGISVEDVHARASQLNVPLEDSGNFSNYRDAQEASAERRKSRIQRAMELERLNSYPELGADRDARILAMARDGVEIRDIAGALHNAFPEITYQDVGKLISASGATVQP